MTLLGIYKSAGRGHGHGNGHVPWAMAMAMAELSSLQNSMILEGLAKVLLYLSSK